jgi:hypothetical protein
VILSSDIRREVFQRGVWDLGETEIGDSQLICNAMKHSLTTMELGKAESTCTYAVNKQVRYVERQAHNLHRFRSNHIQVKLALLHIKCTIP